MCIRILIVDDDADTRRLLARLCEMDGHEVRTAGTISDALNTDSVCPCELLVTDLGLPDGSGVDLARQLRERAGTPAVALTGFESPGDGSTDAFVSYLVKPVNFEQLQVAIRTVTRSFKRVEFPAIDSGDTFSASSVD